MESRTKLVSGKMKKPDVKASDSKDKEEVLSPTPASIAPVAKSPLPPPAPAPAPGPASSWTATSRTRRPTQSRKSSAFLRKSKMLYVADSVGHSVSLRGVELQQNCRIKTARAYSSVYDTRAKWPTKNFADVVTESLKNPGRENIEVLVMSAPTVDITNLDTNIELTPTNKIK